MAHYVFIESRDPFNSADTQKTLSLAEDLKQQGNSVSLFLVQNAVLACRNDARPGRLVDLMAKSGVKIYADDYSLQERGILPGQMPSAIEIAGSAKLLDLIMESDSKPTWF